MFSLRRSETPYFSVGARPYAPALAFHTCVARALHVPASFRPLPTTDLAAALDYARQEHAGGIIVGKHLERHAMSLADHADQSAVEAGATNAMVLTPDGKTLALNSVVGAVQRALVRAHVRSDDRVLIHGAGAPASAVCAALRLQGVSDVVITGRNERTGRLLASLHGYTWAPLVPAGTTVLINATPLGDMGPLAQRISLPSEAIESAAVVIDLALGPHSTPVVRLARAGGIKAIPGMAVVADQWAGIFEAFTGVHVRSRLLDRGLRAAYVPAEARKRGSVPA